ncbi:MAG TPA: hypothetical protein PLP58_20715, partial [Prosthecobacter sp.]|nr:hypothetical protein [Prosthecobacter sp.]
PVKPADENFSVFPQGALVRRRVCLNHNDAAGGLYPDLFTSHWLEALKSTHLRRWACFERHRAFTKALSFSNCARFAATHF